jgi:hypothetical protein
VVVVGAGFGGFGMAAALKRAGIEDSAVGALAGIGATRLWRIRHTWPGRMVLGAPTLAEFEKLVTEHEIHYFVASGAAARARRRGLRLRFADHRVGGGPLHREHRGRDHRLPSQRAEVAGWPGRQGMSTRTFLTSPASTVS